ncbi:unnamed protein product [Porites lobata]|uniref:G-protein coupled receptors family 1 profile domain-containing protein n=1 Tax=Porites lobata TaxID=104759 RepID=A0ABN8RP77_9CNID|nr:unnamed protein product [Porites lobata]
MCRANEQMFQFTTENSLSKSDPHCTVNVQLAFPEYGYLYQWSGLGGNEEFQFLKDGIHREIGSSHPEKEKCNFYVPVWRAEYLRDDTYRHLVALVCIDLIAALSTILLNALVIFAVATRPRLRKNSTILLASLAGADLLTGLVVLPFAFSLDLKRLLAQDEITFHLRILEISSCVGFDSFCLLEKAFTVTLAMVTYASISHLVIISIDRYIAIKYPLRYQEIVTETRIIFSIVLDWGFTLLVTINELVLALIDSESIYSLYMHVNTIIQIVIGTLFIVVISLSYGYIYSETRRQVKRLLYEQLPQEEIQRIKKDRKAVTTLAFILITLGLTYLPAIITGILTTSPGNIVGPPRVQRITWIWSSSCHLQAEYITPQVRRRSTQLHLVDPQHSNNWCTNYMRRLETNLMELATSLKYEEAKEGLILCPG